MTIREVQCAAACRRLKRDFPYRWDLNPYRGWAHPCQYCFAVYSHKYLESASFYDEIFVKTNIVQRLEYQLSRPDWPREVVNIALEQSGIDPQGKYIGFGLRSWKGLEAALPEIAAAANYAYEKHGLTPVFVPIEFPSDLIPADRVGALLKCPFYAVRTRLPIETTIGILARMKVVAGIRLHALMFSAGQGVPVVGMSYDVKVDGFLKYIGSRTCLQLSSVRADALCALIDECVSGELSGQVRSSAALLREREQENSRGAALLLGIDRDGGKNVQSE